MKTKILSHASGVSRENSKYEWMNLSTPVFHGWMLKVFYLVTRSVAWNFIYAYFSRKSGLPQVRFGQAETHVFREKNAIMLRLCFGTIVTLEAEEPSRMHAGAT